MATKKYVSLEKFNLYHEKEVLRTAAEVAAALAEAKKHAEDLGANYDAAGAAATVQGKLDEEVARAKAAEEANAAAAKQAQDEVDALELVVDGKAAQADLDELEGYIGTIPEGATSTNVVAYVQEKTAGIATSENLAELTNRVGQAETDIDNIEKDYLKAADKTELAEDIAEVQGAVDAEAERAAGVETGLRTDIDAIKGDYLKASDKEELQGNIDTVSGAVERLTNGVSAEEIDGVNDLIQYVKDHGAEVTGMQEDIAENAEAIEGVTGRMTTAEGKITAVEGAVATKAEQAALDEAVGALEGADSAQVTRIAALEEKFGEGEGSVTDQIADAKQEAIDTAAQDATTKANTAESNAKTYANDLNTTMNARVEALEAIDHDHANKAELDLIATGDKAKWDAAAAIAHEHTNKTVLDGITAEKVTEWDKVTGKAEQTALQAEIDRATAAEIALGARIDEFVECSEEDIHAMFA